MTDPAAQTLPSTDTGPRDVPAHRVGGLAAIPPLLRSLGIEPSGLLGRAGLAPDALDGPDRQAPFAALVRLLAECADATRRPHFGLLVGERWGLAETGAAGELARLSATVGEALDTLTIYQRLNSQAGAAYLTRYPDVAELGFGIFRRQAQQLAIPYDIAIAAQATVMRELCGPSWRPREVLLPRARPADERPYAEYFRCPVRYDSDRAAIRIAPGDLARDVRSANAARKRALEVELAPRLDEDLVLRLQRSLRILLVDDAASKEFVAQHFAMHRRTLERRLNARGITFQAVLDEVRFEVARQLLHDTQLSMASIAGAIGFEEASSFSRAFTRWAGVSPTRWRSVQRPVP